ncbi:EYxxD motif small membrane protein [Bacillus sp. Bva_UNVM-123]
MNEMFWEYFSDMSFVLIILIGGIVALLYAFLRKSRKGRAR